MKDNNIYIKRDNGRYEAIGVCSSRDYMYDGLWYVKHEKSCTSTTSVPHMASLFHMDVNYVDVNVLCTLKDLTDKVMENEEVRNALTAKTFCLQDFVALITKTVYEITKKDEN